MNERSVRTAWVSHAIVTRTGLLKYVAKRFLQITAMAVLGLWLGGPMSYAQSNAEGYIYGTAPNATSVVIESGTGLTRTVVVKSDGTYLIPALPTGNYKVTAKKGDAAVDVRDDVIVGVGVGTAVRFDGQALQLDKFIVSNSTMPPIDTSRTGASLSIRKETVDELPVIRNLSSVMLLAPQVSKGDAVFGDVPSFAGASVAENNYFVNGFNITDFRTGINFSRVPFDFQQSYQVLVGGYDAEYGRSLGGVTNTTTKSGSNNVVAGVSVYFEPDETNLHSKDVFQSDGLIYKANSLSYNQSLNTEVYAGFPLIKNHVFFYGLYEARDIKSNYASTNATSFYKDSTKNPFWGYKADYRINDDHRLEFTSFSDSRSTHEKTYDYDWDSHTLGAQTSTSQTLRGGLSNIIRYGGNFSEHFQMSLMYGKGSYNQTNSGSGDTLPLIIDSRSGALVYLNGANRDLIETGDDHRKAYRADGVLTFGTNSLKFGADREDNLSNDISSYSGGVYWRYYKAPASGVHEIGADGVRKRQAKGRSLSDFASEAERPEQVPGYVGPSSSACGAEPARAISARVQVQG